VKQENEWVSRIFYERFEEILVCELPKGKLWGGSNLIARGHHSVFNRR
jgi:hypothetical protein